MTADPLQDFLSHLNSHGYHPVGELRVDEGKWGRLMFDGEKPGKASGGYKLTRNTDGSYFANFGSTKDGFRSWKSGADRELSWAEISAEKAARESHRRHLAEVERARHVRIGQRLAKALAGMPDAFDHPYLSDKQVLAHGIRIRPKTGELLIPRLGIDGQIYSIQRIIQKKQGIKSWKGYFKGALGRDLYYPIGFSTENPPVLVFCEGFATGASIFQATGLPVVVCFDTGGLAGIARGMRKKYPDARMIFAADNDQWVFANGKKPKGLETGDISGDDPRWMAWRADGALYNPGVEKAQAAAAAIGGAHVLTPDFPPDQADKKTDFNDLTREKGGEYVKLLFDRVIEIPQAALEDPVEEPGGSGFSGLGSLDVQTTAVGHISEPDRAPANKGDMEMAFKVLGYNNGFYYYFPFALRQIVSLSSAGHTINNLLQLDTLDAWESRWRDGAGKLTAKHQTIALYAADHLTTLAKRRGVFHEEAHVRGAGAWLDDGRVVLHCGDALYVEGQFTPFERMTSDYTYVAAPRLMRPARAPLSNIEARALRTICERISWDNQISGTLLAGWLVIAPICAALAYRPHIYITGEAESGKSTVMDRIIKPVLGNMALCLDGGTSEPAVREAMGYDARPLVYDEAEPSPSMPDVIYLARKATTGAVIKKFGQKPFKARFCACFSAINPPVNKTADESRISFMHIKKNRRVTAMEEYDALCELIEQTITLDYPERLIARTLDNMNALLSNIRIFQRAVRKTVGTARASQQIGTMLAGTYMLGRTDVISEEAALELVSRFSWNDHALIDQEGDPVRLVQWIAGSLVKNRGHEQSIGELVTKVKIEKDVPADQVLRNHGIAVREDRVEIASRSQNLARLLKDTEWHDKWSRTLSDVPGAERKKIAYFAPGIKTSAVSLPIGMFTDNGSTVEQATDDWWPEERE